jgi:hypothetical protein
MVVTTTGLTSITTIVVNSGPTTTTIILTVVPGRNITPTTDIKVFSRKTKRSVLPSVFHVALVLTTVCPTIRFYTFTVLRRNLQCNYGFAKTDVKP